MGITIQQFEGLPLVEPNDDLAQILIDLLPQQQFQLKEHDILVVAQKIVSKAEGRQVLLSEVSPSFKAIKLAQEVEKDARLVEVILQESTEIVRKKKGVLITRHRLGHVSANAGVDQSNISHEAGPSALLLPLDPDKSARKIQQRIAQQYRMNVGVIISDSANRPWRLGSTSIAIGVANCAVLEDRRGDLDIFGRTFKITMVNRADNIATAANLVMGETTEQIPVAIVRGIPNTFPSDQSVKVCHRPLREDLFR